MSRANALAFLARIDGDPELRKAVARLAGELDIHGLRMLAAEQDLPAETDDLRFAWRKRHLLRLATIRIASAQRAAPPSFGSKRQP
jgi:hypothetical protein